MFNFMFNTEYFRLTLIAVYFKSIAITLGVTTVLLIISGITFLILEIKKVFSRLMK